MSSEESTHAAVGVVRENPSDQPTNSTKMSKDDNNPLRKLVNAEREAAEIISREERYRSKRLQEAENAVQEIYEKRRTEEENKFQAEVKSHDGEGDEKLKALAVEVAAEKAEQSKLYDAASETAVAVLLHAATSCEIVVDESQRQAFLALQREKKAAAEGGAAH